MKKSSIININFKKKNIQNWEGINQLFVQSGGNSRCLTP